jgi:hypothetical protein
MDENNNGANGEGNSVTSPVAPEVKTEEKTEEESTPSPEENKEQVQNKPTPFHEDPKVKEYLDRREAKIREEVRKEIEQEFGKMTKKEEKGEEIPEWFGGDLNQWKDFLAYQEKVIEKARTSAVAEFQQKQEEQNLKVKEANEWFASSIETIEGLTSKKIDRNALLAFTLENYEKLGLIDGQGRWDYIKAFKEMEKASSGKPADNKNLDERKKIADSTTKDGSKLESGEKTVKTSEDFKKERPW